MTDVVLSSPNKETLYEYVRDQIGPPFWDEENEIIAESGQLPGGGSYFVNECKDSIPTGKTIKIRDIEVPEIIPLDGYWIRVRMNGENLFTLAPENGGLPLPPETITVYMPTGYPGTPEGYVQPPYGMLS